MTFCLRYIVQEHHEGIITATVSPMFYIIFDSSIAATQVGL